MPTRSPPPSWLARLVAFASRLPASPRQQRWELIARLAAESRAATRHRKASPGESVRPAGGDN